LQPRRHEGRNNLLHAPITNRKLQSQLPFGIRLKLFQELGISSAEDFETQTYYAGTLRHFLLMQ
jgi:hypothetical protein